MADAFGATSAGSLARSTSQNGPSLSRQGSGNGLGRASSSNDLRGMERAPGTPGPIDGPSRRGSELILHAINAPVSSTSRLGYNGSSMRVSQSTNELSSTSTTYGAPQRQTVNWGPPIYPHGPTVNPNSLSSLYVKPGTPIASPPIAFATAPHPPQNIGDDAAFFELYKAVWATFHPIHDGIERPAVQALLPPRAYWMGKRMLDIGCGTGKLCRQFRSAHAQSVTGIDSSRRMIDAASGRDTAEQIDRAAGATSSGGIGKALKRFFAKTLNEQQLAERLARERAKNAAAMQAQLQRDSAKLAAEEALHKMDLSEAERERLSRENTAANSSVSLTKETANFFKRLLKSKDAPAKSGTSSTSTSPRSKSRSASSREESISISLNSNTVKSSLLSDAARRDAASSVCPSSSSSSPDEPDAHPFVPINYIQRSIEEWDVSGLQGTFHLITCTMTMQFIWDLQAFARKVHSLLTPNGLFVSSVDHPIATACWGLHPVAFKNDLRQPDLITHFPLDNYSDQGERKARYYVDGVVKYHRRLDTYINTFLSVGLVLEKISEPRASTEMEAKYPELKTWRRKPLFLCMRWRKPKHENF